MITPKPFLHWAGGKRQLVPTILELMPQHFSAYYEPFVGAGAVFFEMVKRHPHTPMHINDANPELIWTYRAIRENVDRVIDLLSYHSRHYSREYYLEVRDHPPSNDMFEQAARMIFLNKTCFNGLYRVNKSGKFNVAFGKRPNPTICEADCLRACAKALKGVEITFGSFTQAIDPQYSNLVYCDPPYHKTMTSYTAGGFNIRMQEELCRRATAWRDRGATVILSNSNTDLIRDLYSGWKLKEVTRSGAFNGDPTKRQRVTELLIY